MGSLFRLTGDTVTPSAGTRVLKASEFFECRCLDTKQRRNIIVLRMDSKKCRSLVTKQIPEGD